MPDMVSIDALDPQGAGLARTDAGMVRVPYAMPGDRAEVAIDRAAGLGRMVRLVTPSPDRAQPFCPNFGTCGGCATQHVAPAVYLEWKRDIVRQALSAGGIEAEINPCIDAHGAGRRRITLHARRQGTGLRVGFTEARSHAVVPLDACPVTVPELATAFAVARDIADVLGAGVKPLDIAATATLSGLDMDVRGHGPLSERARLRLGDLAQRHDLARLSVHGDVVVERRPPQIRVGKALVSPPAGGFLQATQEGQDILAALVTGALGKARRVADLFAGCGTFALRLAETVAVHAVEVDRAAMAALDQARRHTQGLKAVSTETRDLFRRPLHKAELAAYDAVVFDPPRAGAEAQARMLALGQVPRLIAVSCSPTTLARDLRILIQAGYRLETVTPVDQFRHSAHVETVSVLVKK